MYKEAEEKLNEGLSPVSRWILGFVSGLFGLAMILMAPESSAPLGFIGFGAFFLLIAMACIFKGRIRQFVGSLIGTAVFCAALGYVYSQVTGGPVDSGSRSQPSIINSLLFLLVFGIPGISYAIKAKFGLVGPRQ
ncbi:hypothetical protein [Shewanella pneumatophori]|uniref:Uncharacterized protein n=1 Tax=Shewanella pneumatophori TaxID=314092 RepID=A0A9X1ZNV4_9GAMM|nr:hypothetical protein [Shewanella pneumatophori]MCL1139191.1 hypothetical protein [Shewanella pneumatophori]